MKRTRDRAKRAESNNRLGSGRINSAKSSGRELSAKSRGSGSSGPSSLVRENSEIESKQLSLDELDTDMRNESINL